MFAISDNLEKFAEDMNNIKTGPVEVKGSEIKEFRMKNTNQQKIILFAEKIKKEHEQYENFNHKPEIISVLYMKENYFNFINRTLKTSISTIEYLIIFFNPNQTMVTDILKSIKNNSPEISNYLLEYMSPIYEIKDLFENTTDQEDSVKIIMRERKTKTIESILKDFHVPNEISSSIQELVDNDFNISTIANCVTNIVPFLFSLAQKNKNQKHPEFHKTIDSDNEFDDIDD